MRRERERDKRNDCKKRNGEENKKVQKLKGC